MFVPAEFSIQSKDNKQGRGNGLPDDIQGVLRDFTLESNEASYGMYQRLLETGVARETARGVLNLNIYTKFIWKMDLHNLMHFLDLRLNPHAQQEIRDYAEAIDKMVAHLFPLCHEAFVDYVKESYTCSRMEMKVIRELLWSYSDLQEDAFNIDGLCEKFGMSVREVTDFKRRFFDGK
jgi:thymidylate synthase (FAD)